MTFWGPKDSNLADQLKKGDYIRLRNFRANYFQKATGLTFVSDFTLLHQLDEASVDDSIKLALNEDWEARKDAKKLFVVGKVVDIEQINTFKVRSQEEEEEEECIFCLSEMYGSIGRKHCFLQETLSNDTDKMWESSVQGCCPWDAITCGGLQFEASGL